MEPLNLTCGDAGFTCAYRNTLSWKSATLPLPMENNPQIVFRAAVRRRQHRRAAAGAAQPGRGACSIRSAIRCRRSRRICRPATAAGCANTSTKCARSSGASSRWTRRCRAIWICPTRRWASRPTSRAHLQADVRPAGAGLQVGDHAHLDADVRAREQQRRLPGDRRARRVPQRVAPLERTQEHGSVRRHQPLSREDAGLLPRTAAGDARRRRQRCSTTR